MWSFHLSFPLDAGGFAPSLSKGNDKWNDHIVTAYYCISLHHCITWLTRTIQYDLSLAGQRDWSFTLRIHLSRAPKGKAQKQTISPICTWSLGIPLLGWFITPLKWLIVRDGFLWLQYYVMPQRQVMQTTHSPVAVNRFSPSQGTAL